MRSAAGSGVGFGLRAISGGSAVGAELQAVSALKLRAHINSNTSFEASQLVGVVDRVLCMFAFQLGSLGFVGPDDFGSCGHALGLLGLALGYFGCAAPAVDYPASAK